MSETGLPESFYATLEDLIITKTVAQRAKDIIDIEAILKAHPNLNFDYIRQWVEQFADALETPEMLRKLESLINNRRLS